MARTGPSDRLGRRPDHRPVRLVRGVLRGGGAGGGEGARAASAATRQRARCWWSSRRARGGAEFERRFAPMLGVSTHEGLIERMFAGSGPDARDARRRARPRAAGRADRPDLELVGRAPLPAGPDGRAVRRRRDLRRSSASASRRRRSTRWARSAIALPPDECVFVDDLGFNLKPAKELGMATILHSDSEQTVAQLEDLLGVALT